MKSDSNSQKNSSKKTQEDTIITSSTFASDLVFAILEEQRQRIGRSDECPVEQYFEKHPCLLDSTEDAVDIIYNDFVLRAEREKQDAGPSPVQTEDYLQRFPRFAEQLQNQFQLYYGLGLEVAAHSEGSVPDDVSADSEDLRFEIKEQIGTGGFAVVYRARDQRLKRFVAIKFARNELKQGSRLYRRFQREAKSAARLSHPGIVGVHEFGNQDGRPFIVSQLMEGGTLSDRIEKGDVNIALATDWMVKVCEAIDYAHSCGVVHRDIKPANILFDNDNRPMVADFGLATLAENEHTLTRQGEVIGTPAYMSPEQARGDADVDARTDVYSLGVVLYKLIAGQLPFKGVSSSVLRSVITDEPLAPRSHDSRIPLDIQTICLKAMSKERSGRYSSAREMADDLRRFAKGEPILARPVGTAEKIAKLIRRYPVASALASVVILGSGIALGGLVQYSNVVQQRNRATEAESETERLLARQAENSGNLAFRQGQTQDAVAHLEEALARGIDSPDRIRLLLAKCETINGEIDSAVTNLNSVTDPSLSAAVGLLKVELALRDVKEFGNPIDLIRTIDRQPLSAADQEFLAGLDSNNSNESLQHFKSAIRLDHYHYGARKMAAIMAMSLADFEYVIDLCRSSLLLFTADREFVLIKALALSAVDDLAESYYQIEQADLSETNSESWKEFADFLNEVCQDVEVEGSDELQYRQLISLIEEFVDNHAPLMQARMWHLPPRIAGTFAEYLASETVTNHVGTINRSDAMTQIAETHPEATLNLMIATNLLGSNTNLESLCTSQKLYESAIKSRGFVYEYEHEALEGAFAVAIRLALIEKHNVEENLIRIKELLTKIDPERIENPEHLRVMAIHLINQGELELAIPFTQRWIETARELGDQSQLQGSMWHLAIIFQQKEEWHKLLVSCDEFLKLYPDEATWKGNVAPIGLRNTAVTELKKSIQNKTPEDRSIESLK